MIAIVDYGLGNLGSIANMLRHAGCRNLRVTANVEELRAADKLILPGVGHFDTGMQNLAQRDLVGPLTELVLERRTPVLGICLGMQLMTRGSEEGVKPGLGWVPAQFRRFTFAQGQKLKVPHMGWNSVRFVKDDPLLQGLPENPRFYFVHSYHLAEAPDAYVLGKTTYGYEFGAAFAVGNIRGVQFHPEKSHRFGLALLSAFLRL
jgi:imidazole glycerol-phosphate synthase subunit HisH